MAVAELLAELARADKDTAQPIYEGLSDKDIVAALNEWKHEYVPCETQSLSIKFKEIGLHGKIELAREKGIVDDELWLRWKSLLAVMADPAIPTVLFNEPPILIHDLFLTLLALGIIQEPHNHWLIDLGVRSYTIGRKCCACDVTEEYLAKARELETLNEKVAAQREAVKAEYELKLAQIQSAHDELQKQDGSLMPVGNKDFVPEWEK